MTRTTAEQRKRSEKMLKALANVPDTPAASKWVSSPSFLADPAASINKWLYRLLYPEVFKDKKQIDVTALRDLIRKAWRADRRHAEWYLFRFRLFYDKAARIRKMTQPGLPGFGEFIQHERSRARSLVGKTEPPSASAFEMLADQLVMEQWTEAKRSEPPGLTEFEQAIVHLLDAIQEDRTRCCQRDGCPHPYFFRREKNEKYCSPKCKAEAKREHDKKWARDSRRKAKQEE
jgi:hypothetical protein